MTGYLSSKARLRFKHHALVLYITMMTLCFCSLRWKQKELESFLTELALRLDEEDIRQLQRNVSLALAIYATQIIVVAVVYFFMHVSTDSGLIEVFRTAYYAACVSTFHWSRRRLCSTGS